jgi:hypothetical protein
MGVEAKGVEVLKQAGVRVWGSARYGAIQKHCATRPFRDLRRQCGPHPCKPHPMLFGRRVACSLRHVAAVVGVRAVRFRELVKAVCIGLVHRRVLQLWER